MHAFSIAFAAARFAACASAQSALPFSLALSFGDSMVLRAEGSIVWGTAPASVTSVAATLDGTPLGSAVVGADGVWRVRVPPQPPGGAPHVLTFVAAPAGGAALALRDVLFGHTYGCGGQSNQWYPLNLALNGSAEAQAADDPRYSTIRVLTTGAQPRGPPQPPDFTGLQQPWARASNATVFEFSALCWLFARALTDAWLAAGAAPIPLGLISDNIGGTGIALWASNATLTACGGPAYQPAAPKPNTSDGDLYAALIRPLATGPTLLTGMLWWQAEADAPPYGWSPTWYACMIQRLISDWRAALGALPFWWGFVQLQPFWGTLDWSHGADGWQEIRQAQLAALALPNVSFASAVDIGDPQAPLGSYHPRDKRTIAGRLAAAAQAAVYGEARAWRGPQLRWASVQQRGRLVSVRAAFDEAAAGLAFRNYSCPTDLGVDASVCADFTVFAQPAPPPTWSYLGGGFLGTAGPPCLAATRNLTIAGAKAACEALQPGAPGCPAGCKGFTFISNVSDPGVATPTTLTSLLDFFPETGRDVNWQSYGSSVDFRGAKLQGVNVTIEADGRSISFSALAGEGQRATAAGYGWATWPVSVLQSSAGLPMVPWLSTNVSA